MIQKNERRRYASDLSDSQWAIIEPLFPRAGNRSKWDREALNKLLSNEKYTGRVLLQKTVSVGGSQIKNDGLMDRYLYTGSHEAIISDEMFQAVQQKKLSRAKNPENMVAMKPTVW